MFIVYALAQQTPLATPARVRTCIVRPFARSYHLEPARRLERSAIRPAAADFNSLTFSTSQSAGIMILLDRTDQPPLRTAERREGDDGAGVLHAGDGLHLLGDEMADVGPDCST